jgi:hypothetical protein
MDNLSEQELKALILKTAHLDVPVWYCQIAVDVFGRHSTLVKERLEDRVRESANNRDVYNIMDILDYLNPDNNDNDSAFGEVVGIYLTEVNDSNLYEYYVTCQILFSKNMQRIRKDTKITDDDKDIKACQLKGMLNDQSEKLLDQMDKIMAKLTFNSAKIATIVQKTTRIRPESLIKELQQSS